MSKIDLHVHTTASDGVLTPAQVVARARERGLSHLAITDHDSVGSIAACLQAAAGTELHVVPGIEVSTQWHDTDIHICGLFIDPQSASLKELVSAQLKLRMERSAAIALRLERLGFAGAAEGARRLKPGNVVLTRGSYAQYLAHIGAAASSAEAFHRYLKQGRPAFVRTAWPGMKVAVTAIHAAGGLAVLAHPRRYRGLNNASLRRLITEFRALGGEGMEVSNCQQRPCDREFLADLARQYELLASVGSDFHSAQPWRDLGFNIDLPARVHPVWEDARAAPYRFAVS